jgi:thioredoxin reductase
MRAQSPRREKFDVVIVGGGPAGLSAAVMLGRCRRKVLIVDAGSGRNKASRAMHNYLTRDGISPVAFRRAARAELRKYGVQVWVSEAVAVDTSETDWMTVRLQTGESVRTRKLLLATGVRDILPRLPGFDALYGVSVHHCPYCDGWEHRNQRLAAYGKGKAALGLALSLRAWSSRVTACTDGRRLREADVALAHRNRIRVRTERVSALEGDRRQLRRIRFERGRPLECDAMFFNTGKVQRSNLPENVGCSFKPEGGVKTDARQCTGVPGVYLAGDAHEEVQFVIVAAAEGAIAATAINRALQEEATKSRRNAKRSSSDKRSSHPDR